MLRSYCFRTVLITCLVICSPYFQSSAQADMIYGTLLGDTITVSPDTACEGIQSYTGKDVITIENNASVTNETTNTGWLITDSSAVGIDSGYGKDNITNQGTIHLDVEAIIPVDPLANSATADAVGISAGAGDDTIENSNMISITSKAEINTDGLPEDANTITQFITDLLNNFLSGGENSVIDATTATATGMDTGNGDNNVHNTGQIHVNATALQTAGSIINAGVAKANGIVGGSGDDTIVNDATINANASANIYTTSISAEGQLAALSINASTATAEATGIDAKAGNDTIVNNGTINVISNAGISPQGASAESMYLSGAFGTATANTLSKGIDGGSGSDTITNGSANEGDINVNAVSPNESGINVDAVSEISSQGASSESGLLSGAFDTIIANAESIGIDGGSNADKITSQSKINVNAKATVSSQGASATSTGLAASLGISSASATATGINGGLCNDEIENNGEINVTSNAEAGAAGTTGTITGPAGAITLSTAEAQSTGIDGDEGDDNIISTGNITTGASATAEAVTVSISGTDLTSLIIPSGWDGVTKASASSTGISGGLGNNTINNQGHIDLTVSAQTESGNTAVTPIGAAISFSNSTAIAEATGIEGGYTNQNVTNSGNLDAEVTSTAKAVGVSVSGAGAAISSATFWNGGTTAKATSTGIKPGLGEEALENSGDIDIDATAATSSVNVSADIVGVASSFSTSKAASDAMGIDAGLRYGGLTNYGDIDANAEAEAEAVSVSISGIGVSLAGDSIWNGGTSSQADAVGISSGFGDDDFLNHGDVKATATATTSSVNVAVSAVGVATSVSNSTATAEAVSLDVSRKNGNTTNTGILEATATADTEAVDVAIAGMGIAVSANAETSAEAEAMGIKAGCEKDIILNLNKEEETTKITINTTAKTDSVNVSVSGLGGSLSADSVLKGGVTADAVSTGIDAGWGDDEVTNEADIEAKATSDTDEVGVSATVIGIASTISSTTTASNAVCINGDAGDDILINSGNLTAAADSTADSTKVNASALGVSVSADAVWNGGTTAESTATAILGGCGKDTIQNSGKITVDTESTASVVEVSLEGIGGSTSFSFRDTSTKAKSNSVGIDGGGMADDIQNRGTINATAASKVDGTNVALTLLGFNNTDSGISGEASSTGISGGWGADTIVNENKISASSSVSVDAVAVSGSIAGVTTADVSATAKGIARGIDGGLCSDLIQNNGDIDVAIASQVDATNVSVTAAGYSGVNADVVSEADGAGIYGDEGNDEVINTGDITIKTKTDASATSVGITLAGATVSNSDVTANITVSGISGGDGNDTIENSAQINVISLEETDSNAVSVNLAGAAITDAGITAKTTTRGIFGGDGDDKITNSGDIYVTAGSVTDADSVAVSLVGYSGSNAGITTEMTAIGIDGGEGNDDINNSGKIDVKNAEAVDSDVVSVSLAGASVSDAEITAKTTTTGIFGGEGDDKITNSGDIYVTAASVTNSDSISVSLAGGSSADAGVTTEVTAIGIDGGEGNDDINNSGNIDVKNAEAVDSDLVSVSLVGASFTDAGMTVSTTTTGIFGGEGDDKISNSGEINVTAASVTNVDSTSVSLAGYSASSAGITTQVTAIGIDGGEGKDEIVNQSESAITVVSEITTKTNGVEVTLAGASDDDTATTIKAETIGIDGGAGDDTIRNEGDVDVTATATADATGTSVTLAGANKGDAEITAEAYAIGIDGSEGADDIENTNKIIINTNAYADSGDVDVTLVGDASGKTGTIAKTDATGIDGGDDADIILNKGDIDITAIASTNASDTSVMLAGSSTSDIAIEAEITATGIRGGSGNDDIENSGTINITNWDDDNTSPGSIDAVSVNIAGNLENVTCIAVDTQAKGIDGGTDDDNIRNSGKIFIDINTTLESDGSANVGFGANQSDAAIDSKTTVIGIDGGDGDDFLENANLIEISSKSSIDMGNDSFTFGGTVSQQGSILATAEATGITGGTGDDYIRNYGTINAYSDTSFTINRNTDTAFGKGSGSAEAGTDTLTMGIDGGTGDDIIDNVGSMNISSHAEGAFGGDSFTFAGESSNMGELTISAQGIGINGGDGDDIIRNGYEGNLVVSIDTGLNNSNDSDVAFGKSDNAVKVGTETTAKGIVCGSGQNEVENNGDINVSATSTIDLNGATYAFGGNSSSTGELESSATAVGISGGSEADVIQNSGDVSVNATSQLSATGVASTTFGNNGAAVTIQSSAEAVGFDLGDGDNEILNEEQSTLSVNVKTTGLSETGSDVGWFSGGDSISETESSCTAYGIRVGNDDNTIVNKGNIEVTIGALDTYASEAQADSEGNNLTDWVDGDAYADTTATSDALAVGIETGSGDNIISNSGELTVTATSPSYADAYADGDGSVFGLADGDAYADAVTETQAFGIKTGNGNNEITNDGILLVKATSVATAKAEADGDSSFWPIPPIPLPGYAYADADATATAEAVGIQTGNGDNVITNSGSIEVTASVTASTDASADSNWPGSDDTSETRSTEVSAIGILTGEGNDIITNYGDITAKSDGAADMAISTNGGNDQVILEDGSSLYGNINLGSGDDALTFKDTAAFDHSAPFADGNSGTDTLIFCGTGDNNASFYNFESAVKRESGIYTVHHLPQKLQRIEVTQGKLNVQGDYEMSGSGTFQATLNTATQYGQFDVDGTAYLDGNLNVIHETSAIPDGATFDILTADKIENDFSTETLPEPTELVSFALNKDSEKVQVTASVEPFTSVAENETHMKIAAYLDELVPTAEGNLSRAIGTVQMLPASDFYTAFSSLSPEVYTMSSTSTICNTVQYTRTVENRLMIARAQNRDSIYAPKSNDGPLLLAFNGKDMGQYVSSGSGRSAFSMWIDGFGQMGSQNNLPDFTGYDYTMTGMAMGMDYAVKGFGISDHFIAGLSIGYSGTNITLNNDLSEIDIKQVSIAGYSSFEIRNLYFESVLSYGKSSYDIDREYIAGTTLEKATSTHDGDVITFSTGCGYYIDSNDWRFIPFTAMKYITIDEEASDETGAPGFNQHIDARQTNALTMDLGLKVSRLFKTDGYAFAPEVSLAWNYDFDIDDRTITARFTEAQGTSFTIDSPETPKHGIMTGAGIQIMMGNAITTSIFYNGEFREDYTSHGIIGKVQYMFE